MKNINEDIKRIKGLMGILENQDGVEDYFKQKYTGQSGPHDENDMAPDGMDDDSDDDSDVNEEDLEEYEINEEGESTSTSTSTASTGAGSTSKWADVVGSQLKRSQGNQIKTQPWASGITKGAGNQSK